MIELKETVYVKGGREQEEDIDHQFDVWHFSKSIKTNLLNISKKKACEDLRPWIKSICNHLWWSSATCEQNELLLKEKWISVLFHIQNKHSWTGDEKYHECCPQELSTEEERTSMDFNWIRSFRCSLRRHLRQNYFERHCPP